MDRSNPNAADLEILARASEALAAGSVYPWVWEISEDRVFVTHAALARLFDLDPEEASEGLPIESFARAIHDEDRERVMEAVERSVENGGEYAADYRVIDALGELRWVAVRGEAEYSPEGQPLRFTGILIDVTERKRAEEALRRSERRFRRLSEQAADAAFVHDLIGNFVEVNDRACQSLGYSREELLSMQVQDVERDLVPGGFVEIWQRGYEGDPVTIEGVHRRKDGSEFPVEVRVGALEREEEPLILALVRDITERKRTEERLRSSEEHHRAVVQTATDAIITADTGGIIRSFNPAARRIFGYTDEEILCQPLRKLMPERFREAHEKGLRRYLQTGHSHLVGRGTVEFAGLRKSGEEFPLELSLAQTRGADGVLFTGILRDISRRKNAEAERERLLEREQEISHTLQRSLLPPSMPEIPGVELAGRYVAFGEGMEVGGDFYDVFSVPGDHWALAVGDVTGKGPEAATLTSLARHTIRAAAAREVGNPGRVLSLLNEEILRQIDGARMVTVIFGELEPAAEGWTLSLATGGHPPPFILRASGEVESCDYGAGTILGAFEDPRIGGWEVLLRPGDAALLYTDGATEARAPTGEFFGEERLSEVCAGCAGLGAEEIATRIERAVVEFQRGNPRDDVALLVLKIPGAEESG